MQTNPSDEIVLAYYTYFDWDKVMVFRYPTSAEDVERELGVDCPISKYGFDLTSGIIFVKGNIIVHYELFKMDYEKGAKFAIYPVADLDEYTRQRVFSNQDAVFSVSFFGRSDGKLAYALFPVN